MKPSSPSALLLPSQPSLASSSYFTHLSSLSKLFQRRKIPSQSLFSVASLSTPSASFKALQRDECFHSPSIASEVRAENPSYVPGHIFFFFFFVCNPDCYSLYTSVPLTVNISVEVFMVSLIWGTCVILVFFAVSESWGLRVLSVLGFKLFFFLVGLGVLGIYGCAGFLGLLGIYCLFISRNLWMS